MVDEMTRRTRDYSAPLYYGRQNKTYHFVLLSLATYTKHQRR